MGIDYNKRKSTPPTPAEQPPTPAAPPAPSGGPIDTSKRPSNPPAPAGGSPISTSKASAPAAPPATPVSTSKAEAAPAAGPISLTKKGQSVSLTKGGSGPVRINLNWTKAEPAPAGGGMFKRLAAAASGKIDLDLGCLFELSDGRKGVVQALGNSFGSLDGPPFIKLDKDDRSGAATDGENLFIAGDAAAHITRIAVFAFIYEGAQNWSKAGGVVTVHPPAGAPITIALDEARDGVGMCAVCLIHGGPGGYTVERQVQYVSGHKELDERYGWGMNWVRGSK